MKRSQQTLIAFIAFICIASTSFIALAANNTETKRVAGNGKIQSKSVSLENFKGINVGGNFMMVINSGTEPKVVVTSDENILPYINLSVSHQQLNIGQQSGINLSPSKLTKIQITVPKLNNINISGNTMLQANNINTDSLALIMGGKTSGNLQGEIKNLQLSLGGNNDLKVHLKNSNSVNLNVGGEGNIELTGRTKNLTITSGGNIKISADNLIAENVAITAAGKSNIRVHASTTLSVTTAGYSEVKYAGNPKISKSTFGAASIQKITK